MTKDLDGKRIEIINFMEGNYEGARLSLYWLWKRARYQSW